MCVMSSLKCFWVRPQLSCTRRLQVKCTHILQTGGGRGADSLAGLALLVGGQEAHRAAADRALALVGVLAALGRPDVRDVVRGHGPPDHVRPALRRRCGGIRLGAVVDHVGGETELLLDGPGRGRERVRAIRAGFCNQAHCTRRPRSPPARGVHQLSELKQTELVSRVRRPPHPAAAPAATIDPGRERAVPHSSH